MIPVTGLFETHLTVTDLARSVSFYQNVLGLTLASRFDERRCAFFWIGPEREAMLGLWETGTGPQRMQLHTAFRVEMAHLLAACEQLRQAGLVPLDFHGEPTAQPVVLAWMPAASVYFRDPDGHLLEFLALLPSPPCPALGILSWSDWCRASRPLADGAESRGGEESDHAAP